MSSASVAASADAATSSSPHITKDNIETFDYFQLFGLSFPVPSSSSSSSGNSPSDDIDVAAVRRVYRRLSLRFHPDKDDSAEARHAFEVVHAALETLIDPAKRAAYVAARTEHAGGTSNGGAEEARQRERAQQAQEEAQWAADLLVQREQERRAKEAAARQIAQEREEAAQRLLAELTGSLHTPFQQMEAELVRDWDVDEEMVAMKEAEVMKLLRQVAPECFLRGRGPAAAFAAGNGEREREESVGDGASRKRGRDAADEDNT